MSSAAEFGFDEQIIVGNGCKPPEVDGWRSVESPNNLGVPGGRSFGIGVSTSAVLVFLDDDSVLPDRSKNLVEGVRNVFDNDEHVGALAFRVNVTGTDRTMRRWSPTPVKTDSTKTGAIAISDVPTFPGNGHALRRAAFEDVGGYLDELFFKHEETELSWRLLDAGWRVVMDPAIVVEHPETSEARHGHAIELGLRNKIWISRLRLPAPVAALATAVSALRTLGRCRSTADLKAAAAGLRRGLGQLPGDRKPISWKTVGTLTRSGRPPIF